jgi:hypothetical protein
MVLKSFRLSLSYPAGAELGTDNGKTERQPTQTINNQHPTTRNRQQPPTTTPDKLQSALDNRHPTTINKREWLKKKKFYFSQLGLYPHTRRQVGSCVVKASLLHCKEISMYVFPEKE